MFPKHDGYMVEILHETDDVDIDHISNNYDGMYIWWWNTFRLLKLIKDTWLDHVIRALLAGEKSIYGWSAGAIILWKDIHTSPDVNVTKLSFHESVWFNLFAWHSIFCHYTDAYDLEIYDYIAHYQFPVIALPEWVWVYLKYAVMYIWWHTSAYLFTAWWKKEIMPGEHV